VSAESGAAAEAVLETVNSLRLGQDVLADLWVRRFAHGADNMDVTTVVAVKR
jgi:hypothetical protein